MKEIFTVQLIAIIVASCTGLFANLSSASTPSELADLSLQELMNLTIGEPRDKQQFSNRWKLGVFYTQLRLDGYMSGDSDVRSNDVLFESGGIRSERNFPIVPTKITQEIFMARVEYAIDGRSRVNFSVPYIKQSTDHISSVANYDEFMISTKGIGDVTANYYRELMSWEQQRLTWSVGVSIPTGSIDEQGDTPRAPGNQLLPYTMQLSSGTWDFPVGLRYQSDESTWAWGGNLLAKIRLGENDRNYRLGNRFTASMWAKGRTQYWLKPLVRLSYIAWGKIHGQDDEITVPNPSFPYPAAITNPNYFGGEKVKLSLGVELPIGAHSVTAELGVPLYQNLNGIQNDEKMSFSFNWNIAI